VIRPLCLVVAALLFATAPTAGAQQRGSVPILGVLRTSSFVANDPSTEALKRALREIGYVEGQNINLVGRFAEGQLDRLPQLAQDLVQLKVDVILAPNHAAVRAAKQATATIPIVMVLYDYDPVASGLIQSLSRPGGNVTGIFSLQPELGGKRLELLKETLPGLSRVAVFYDANSKRSLEQLEAAARSLGLHLQPIELQSPDQLPAAFKSARGKAGAAMILYSPMIYAERARIGALALKTGLPTMAQERDFVEAGALMSYAPDRDAVLSRAAYFIDRILKGVSPGSLPVEQASKFKLSINLKAAKGLKLTIPQSVLLRADEVIR
jgi:putative ABC transport system substrate-binding protein